MPSHSYNPYMAAHSRRKFLKGSAGVVAGAAIGACTQDAPQQDSKQGSEQRGLDRDTLDALAMLVLPKTALGKAGINRVTGEFLHWLDAFDPATELNHPYYSEEINYGPPDPAPLWGAQLRALDIEAQNRIDKNFHAISEDQQIFILERHLPQNASDVLPYAGNAPHVSIGLIAYFYATSEANDLCLDAKVGRQTCRGLHGSPDKPAPLGD